MDMWAPSRSRGGTEDFLEPPPTMHEDTAELASHDEGMEELPQGAEREPVGDPVLHPRPAALLPEQVAVLPAGVGTAHLNVHESVGWIPFADQAAPAEREPQPADSEVEDRPGLDRVRRIG